MSSFSKPLFQSRWDWIMLCMCGLCMGAADLVPGISGGTIAFILGFYHDLLSSIKTFDRKAFGLLLRFQIKEFGQTVAWEFLLTLGSGVLLAFILFSTGISYVLNHETYRVLLYSSFLGLICASAFFFVRQIQRWTFISCIALFIGVAGAYFLTGNSTNFLSSKEGLDIFFPSNQLKYMDFSKPIRNYDLVEQRLLDVPLTTVSAMLAKKLITTDTPVYNPRNRSYGVLSDYFHTSVQSIFQWHLILCGAVAICAMLLPGISGSYVLVILGVYTVVIGALSDFIAEGKQGIWDQNAFMILMNLMVGIALGALSFARIASWFLKRYPDFSIALLTGFMMGALRFIWPFWSYEYFIDPLKPSKGLTFILREPLLPDVFSPLFFVAVFFAAFAFIFIFLLESWSAKMIPANSPLP
jgi:putative membrane protein